MPCVSAFHDAEPNWSLTSFSAIMPRVFSFTITMEAVPPVCCWYFWNYFVVKLFYWSYLELWNYNVDFLVILLVIFIFPVSRLLSLGCSDS